MPPLLLGLKKILAGLGFNVERWTTLEARCRETDERQARLEGTQQRLAEELDKIRLEVTTQRSLSEQATSFGGALRHRQRLF